MKQLHYILGLILLTSCANDKAEAPEGHHQHEHSSTDRLAELEAIVYSDTATVLNVSVAVELANLYVSMVNEQPMDSTSADLLFKAGELYMNAKHGNKAIARFKDVHTRFPANEMAPVARFLKGFVAETVLQDMELAEQFYTEFVNAHPDHSLAEDAKASIALLGLSDEELMKRFKIKEPS